LRETASASCWCIIAGSDAGCYRAAVEPEDATAADAARRGVVEETGALLLPDATFIGTDVHGIPAKGREPVSPPP
jgi:hypothetical protein